MKIYQLLFYMNYSITEIRKLEVQIWDALKSKLASGNNYTGHRFSSFVLGNNKCFLCIFDNNNKKQEWRIIKTD